jgi:hypothetical protein
MSTTGPAPETPEAPAALDCDEVVGLSRAFASGTLDMEDTRRLRSHLAHCRECMNTYRDAVQTTAQLGRFTIEEREKRLLDRQRRARHAKVFSSPEKVSKRPNWLRLRLILMPAFFIYLMIQITGFGPPPARVDLVKSDGQVSLQGREVGGREHELLVLPGRWVTTGLYSKAWLDARTAKVRMSGETELLLESARPVRLRLRRGGLEVEGDITLVTALGLLEISEGRGHVFLGDGGLRLDPVAGSWKLFDRRGERSFPMGETSDVHL